MKKHLLRLWNLLILAAAFNFLVLLVLAAVLVGAGVLDREKAASVLLILRGQGRMFSAEELAAWEAAPKRPSAPGAEGQERERELAQAREDLERLKTSRQQEMERERLLLEELRREVQVRQEELSKARTSWEETRRSEEEKRKREGEQKSQAARRKVLTLYSNMEPADVAADLRERWKQGERSEVAGLLAEMNERAASEILTELRDPAVRNEIIAFIAKTK